MHVEGLTRENVASHLQKFRLQLRKENRLDDEGNLLGGSPDEAEASPQAHSDDAADVLAAVAATPDEVGCPRWPWGVYELCSH
jgi:hypothetical protein